MSKSDNAGETSQKPRWRFTLRELFLFSVVIATLLGWLIQVKANNARIHLSETAQWLGDPFTAFARTTDSRPFGGGGGYVTARHPRSMSGGFEAEFGISDPVEQGQTLAEFQKFLIGELEKRNADVLAIHETDQPEDAIAFTIHFATTKSRGIVAVHVQYRKDRDDIVRYRLEERPL